MAPFRKDLFLESISGPKNAPPKKKIGFGAAQSFDTALNLPRQSNYYRRTAETRTREAL